MEMVVTRFMAWTWHFLSTATLLKELTLILIVGLLYLIQKMVVVNLEAENKDETTVGMADVLWLLLMLLGAVLIMYVYPTMDPVDEISAYTWRDMNAQLMMLFFCLSITKSRVVQLMNIMLPGAIIVYFILMHHHQIELYQLAAWFGVGVSVVWAQAVTKGLRFGGWQRIAAELLFAASWWGLLVVANDLTLEHFLVLIGEFVLSMWIVHRSCLGLRALWYRMSGLVAQREFD